MWFILFLILLAGPACAQEATVSAAAIPTATSAQLFNQYQTDYLYQYNLYQQAYTDYVNKKQIFTKYGTVTTQNDQFHAAVTTIIARNRVFKSYLMALRVMLENNKTADTSITEAAQIGLRNWENWFDQQTAIVSAFKGTDDLQPWAKDFKVKYNQIQVAIFTALVQNEINLRLSTLNLIQSLADDLQNDPNLKPDSQQWTQSLSDQTNQVNTSIAAAVTLSKKVQLSDRFSNFYPGAQTNLARAKKYLTDISGNLKLTIIKYYQP
jgi:hypothetical protein